MLYRLFTEDINRDVIETLAKSVFDAFTIFNGKGYWGGRAENSLILEVVGQDTPELATKFRGLARRIKEVNNQQAVLIQSLANCSEMI